MHLADATGNPPEWRGGAACRHHDPDLFFPEGTAGPALRQVDQAKRVCRSCPVRTPCLGFALRHGVAFGIWGGVTAEERRQGSARLGGPDLRASRHGEYHAGNKGGEIWAARFARGAPHRPARHEQPPRLDRPPGHPLTD